MAAVGAEGRQKVGRIVEALPISGEQADGRSKTGLACAVAVLNLLKFVESSQIAQQSRHLENTLKRSPAAGYCVLNADAHLFFAASYVASRSRCLTVRMSWLSWASTGTGPYWHAVRLLEID